MVIPAWRENKLHYRQRAVSIFADVQREDWAEKGAAYMNARINLGRLAMAISDSYGEDGQE